MEPTNTNTNTNTLLQQVLELLNTISVKTLAQQLNVATGTVQRWIDLENVPPQYTFDILRIMKRDVDYSVYSPSEKDQFYTPPAVAKYCFEKFKEVVPINVDEYIFIEPSAGDGSFLGCLPPDMTLAVDIEPRHASVIKEDYLKWTPSIGDKIIVFGNPPFGLRGHIALQFINHSYAFADYVCFILPQLFESDGKGSPRKRVQGYHLIHSEKLSADFHTPDPTQKKIPINCVFQIWSKHTTNEDYDIEVPPTDSIRIYSLSDGGTVATTRNKNRLESCDIYIPSTCFGKENMRAYSSFEELPNRKGYGVVFLKDREQGMSRSRNIDWSSVSFLSTNSAYNLRTSLIYSHLNQNLSHK